MGRARRGEELKTKTNRRCTSKLGDEMSGEITDIESTFNIYISSCFSKKGVRTLM